MINRLIAFIAFVVCSFFVMAQTTLNRGDLAILGVNTTITPSTQDEISFVCFKDITKGTTLQLTDNGYEACTPNQWSSAEGGATLTRTGGTIAAGTVMTLRDAYTNGNPIRFTSPDAGWNTEDLVPNVVKASYLDMNSKGDQLYMAQNGTWTMIDSTSCTVTSTVGGSTTTPNGDFPGIDGRILFGFSTSGAWQSLQASTGESGLYKGMDCFTNAVVGASKYNKYTGSLAAGTQTEWLARINTPSNWHTYNSSNAYFAASPDFSSLKLSINANGLVPTPTWASPKGLYCTDKGILDLNTLVTGTKGGSWSGTGVSANGLFNPSGLNGNYDINYAINYNTGTGICPLSQTDTIHVGSSVTPTFAAIPSVVQGSVAPILPKISTNIPPITGTWNALVNTLLPGTTNYTFTPTTAKCSPNGIVSVKVIRPALNLTGNCLGNILRLNGVSDATKIEWYKNGKLDTTLYQSRATVGVTVAGGKNLGAANTGKTNDLFNLTYGVVVDSIGTLYVSEFTNYASTTNDRVMKWAKGATTGTVFAGASGFYAPQPANLFRNPAGLYLTPTGALYVAYYINHKVQKFSTDGSSSTLVGGNGSAGTDGPANLGYPNGIYVDTDSNLFVADAGLPKVPFLYDPKIGNRIMEWAPGAISGDLVAGNAGGAGTDAAHLSYPTGVYVNKKGDIYVADLLNTRIVKWAKGANTGTVIADLTNAGPKGLAYPTDIKVDENTDTMYITATNDVAAFIGTSTPNVGSEQNLLLKWKEGASSGIIMNNGNATGNSLLAPSSLAIGKDGSIYVADRGNSRVQAWLTSIDTTYKPIQTGTYYAVITHFSGLVDTSNTIEVGDAASHTTNASICSGDTYTFNGVGYTTAGKYTAHILTTLGCDSTDILVLTIKSKSTSTTNITTCPSGLPFNWNGLTFTSAGTQTAHLLNSVGCDSAATLVLTVTNTLTSTTNLGICSGALPYSWNGLTFTKAETQTATLKNNVGCDSLATLVLSLNPPITSTTNLSICAAALPYHWNGLTFNAAGTQTATLKTNGGCDSLATLVLTLSPPITSTTNLSICAAALPFHWNGLTFSAAGTQTATLKTGGGCDSLATLVLTVNNPTTSSAITSACTSFSWNGTTYNKSGTYTYTTKNANGCDSTATLLLTINNPTSSSTTVTACSSYIWNGGTYNKSGTYTYTTKNAADCDSTATLTLTINTPTTSTTSLSACSSYTWNATTYTKSGNYTYTTKNAKGCDSIATLILTVNYPTTTTKSVTTCKSYTWNGTTYTTSGTYDYITKNGQGCFDTARLFLTINYPTTSSNNIVACGSYTWNNTTYTQSGSYTFTTKNSFGCDSIATLNLTVNKQTTSTTSIIACSNYTWNNTTYTKSGTYAYTIKNANGCDSTATLLLTINSPTSTSTTITACSSYIWNNTTYTKSGTYTYISKNAAGCDNTATLFLTINSPTISTTTASICPGSSYTFNGTSYSKGGNYLAHLTNSTGCDSTANLILHIKDTTSSVSRVGICPGSSYTFNSITYTTPNTYTAHLTNNVGCDSTAKLILYIKDTTSSVTRVTICGGSSYIFNGTSYNTSGTYTAHLTNSEGCDSTAKLELNVVYGYTIDTITGNNAVCIYQTIPLEDGTRGGIWKSSDTAVISIDSLKGSLYGKQFGNSTISYTVRFQCGTVTTTRVMPVLGVQPQSNAIPHDASCTNLLGGSIDVAIKGNEGPFNFSFQDNNYNNPYTLRNITQGTYDIYVYNRAGCLVDSVNNILVLLDKDANCDTIYIPQGFVPTSTNVTGVTKLLRPYGGGNNIKSVHFRVLNRYGNIVFESHDLFSGWDGRINGVLQETGAYIWFLDYVLPNGQPKTANGTTVLIK